MFPTPKRVKDKKAILKARKEYCEHCGSRYNLQIHHKTSVGAGGGDTPDNLITLCAGPPNDCHGRAHSGHIKWVDTRGDLWVDVSGDF